MAISGYGSVVVILFTYILVVLEFQKVTVLSKIIFLLFIADIVKPASGQDLTNILEYADDLIVYTYLHGRYSARSARSTPPFGNLLSILKVPVFREKKMRMTSKMASNTKKVSLSMTPTRIPILPLTCPTLLSTNF